MRNSEKPNNTKDDCISRQAAIDAVQNVSLSFHIVSNINLTDMKEEIQMIIDEVTKAQTDALMKLQAQEKVVAQISKADVQNVVKRMFATRKEAYAQGFHDGVKAFIAHLELHKEETEAAKENTETWHGMHGDIKAPAGTFDKIYNDAEEDEDDF